VFVELVFNQIQQICVLIVFTIVLILLLVLIRNVPLVLVVTAEGKDLAIICIFQPLKLFGFLPLCLSLSLSLSFALASFWFRFLGPPWQAVPLESKELMIMCLRKIGGLTSVKVTDAVWIWTEEHSLRLKIKLTVQKEVLNGALLQQSTIVEFLIRNQQCKTCEQSYAQGAWESIVQVRQRVLHKRTFFYLEQLILKHRAHSDCVKIVTFKDGIDFYFKGNDLSLWFVQFCNFFALSLSSCLFTFLFNSYLLFSAAAPLSLCLSPLSLKIDKNQGLRFVEFLKGNMPLKIKYSRKLISADKSDNTAEFKHSYLIDIAPICKDDLLLLPKELAAKQSNISPLVLVKRIGASLYVVDPLTSEVTQHFFVASSPFCLLLSLVFLSS
jgi:nonsense-mediated mRNA decay protein 3